MILRGLLAFLVVYMVFESHLAIDTGITGVNLANLLLVCAVVLLVTRRDPDPPPPAQLRTALLLWFVALGVGFAIAITRAPDNLVSDITYLKNAIFYPLLYFVMLRSRLEFKHVRLLVILTLAVAAIGGAEAIRQALDWGIGHFQESHRSTGPFGTEIASANRAGVYFAMYLPMFIAIALFFRRQLAWRVAALGGAALLTLGILFTYSRQSYFIALIGLAVLGLRRSVVLASILGVSLLALSSYLPEGVSQRVSETTQRGSHGQEEFDESTESRWEIWSGAMEMWKQNPSGVGLQRFRREIGQFSQWHGMDAHNFYVLTLAEMGPLGVLTLLWLIYSLFRLAAWLRRMAPEDDPEARALALGFTVATLCMAVGNLYGSPFLEGRVMGSYWMLCGLLERYMYLLHARIVAEEGQLPAAPAVDMAARFPLAARTLPGRYRATPRQLE